MNFKLFVIFIKKFEMYTVDYLEKKIVELMMTCAVYCESNFHSLFSSTLDYFLLFVTDGVYLGCCRIVEVQFDTDVS